jgi:hypothetical protein
MQRVSSKKHWLTGAVLALSISPAIARGDILGFDNFFGFTLNQLDGDAAPTISPGAIRLTSASSGQRRSLFYNTPQSIAAFTAKFTYRTTAGNVAPEYGAVFVLQNSPNGPAAIGAADGFSYGGITPSAAVTLELSSFSTSRSGYYKNGIMGGGSSLIAPVSYFSGNPINVTISYDGTFLHTSFVDTVTSASYAASYLADLPAVLGSQTAYVGFTAGTSNASAEQHFSNFQYLTVPEPTSAVMGSMALLALVMLKRRRRTFRT